MGKPNGLEVDDLTADEETRKHLRELLDYIEEYEERLIERLVLPRRWPRPLQERASHFLVLILQRARLLLWGILGGIKHHNYLAAILCTRAHYECTGSIAYCLSRLRSMYNGNISRKVASDAVDKLLAGSQTLPWEVPDELRFNVINVLNGIDTAGDLAKKMSDGKITVFRERYNFLCELCHPNMLGIRVGSRPTSDLLYCDFDRDPVLNELEMDTVATYACLSHACFFLFYDKAWELLRAKEKDLPQLIKRLTSTPSD